MIDDEFGAFEVSPGDRDREQALDAIVALNQGWRAGKTHDFTSVRLRPDLEASRKRILLLSLTGDVPRALMRRLAVARERGFHISVALGTSAIETRILLELQELDARILAVSWDEGGAPQAASYRSVSDWIASRRISLAPEDLKELATARLNTALAEPTNIKGRFYEEVLCLVFSQVPWLTVDFHAYRNTSEEIDVVLGVHATGHIAELARGAVAIATAKNESVATGSETVKYLKEQIANRKGRCKLGFLCSARTISGDAKNEILRGSQSSDVVIVELDLTDLRMLIANAYDIDTSLQGLIRRAVAS